MTLKGTQTEKNLLKAFAGESQARSRYTIFSNAAREEGYEQIADFFKETAEQELEHAKVFFNYLEGGDAEITATYPAGMKGTTSENLKMAAEGEQEEWETLYPEFARVAAEEGFKKISNSFKMIAKIEKEHEARYRKLLDNMEQDLVFVSDSEKTIWLCKNCGYIHVGKKAPKGCPVCLYPRAYFERKQMNY